MEIAAFAPAPASSAPSPAAPTRQEPFAGVLGQALEAADREPADAKVPKPPAEGADALPGTESPASAEAAARAAHGHAQEGEDPAASEPPPAELPDDTSLAGGCGESPAPPAAAQVVAFAQPPHAVPVAGGSPNPPRGGAAGVPPEASAPVRGQPAGGWPEAVSGQAAGPACAEASDAEAAGPSAKGLREEAPAESLAIRPGERGRTERLWGFWLRRAAQAPGEGARTPGVARVGQAPEELAAAAAPSAAEAPEAGSAVLRPPEPGSRSEAPEAAGPTPGTARGFPQGPRELSETRPSQAPAPALQVGHGVRMALARGGDRVVVRLEPEHLGRVQVVLGREAGGLTAHLRVENPQAQQALTAELPLLRQNLEARGVNLVHVQIDLADGQAREERPGSEAWGRRRRGAGSLPPDADADVLAARGAGWRPWGFEAVI